MSHFYGTLDGQAGTATRRGSKKSGINTVAASWSGAIAVRAYERDGVDMVRIAFSDWHGAGRNLTLYDGPINPSDEQIFAAMVRHAPAALGIKQ